MGTKEKLEIVEKAEDAIKEFGWQKGNFGYLYGDKPGPMCGYGALRYVATGDPKGHLTSDMEAIEVANDFDMVNGNSIIWINDMRGEKKLFRGFRKLKKHYKREIKEQK